MAYAEYNAQRHVCARKDSIRRATRRHRCARCGLEATYENAGATEARYWFGRHSCRKREEAMLRHAMAETREALIDRTPKPCLHKVADHQHGTSAAYRLDHCKCIPCARAATAAESTRRRLKAYGRYNKYVPALPVREHVRALMDAGVGLKTIAKRSGVSTGTLSKLIYGVYAPGTYPHRGRNGKGDLIRPPSRRVLRETAEKLYAIDPAWSGSMPLADGAKDPAGTPAARQKLQSLVALGWSMSEIGRRLGMAWPRNGITVIQGPRAMTHRTVEAANALFEQLCMTPPPETNQRERISAARSRKYAADHDWLPPLALDLDDEAVVEEETPDVDEVAIQRRMGGDRSVRLSKAESVELVTRWRASGRPLAECERMTGLKPERYYAERQEVAS
jgi:hypothetical protein